MAYKMLLIDDTRPAVPLCSGLSGSIVIPGTVQVMATVSAIDGTGTGATELLAAAATVELVSVRVRLTGASGVTGPPQVRLNVTGSPAPPRSVMVQPVTLRGLKDEGQSFELLQPGLTERIVSGQSVEFEILSAATVSGGGSYTLTVDVIGYAVV